VLLLVSAINVAQAIPAPFDQITAEGCAFTGAMLVAGMLRRILAIDQMKKLPFLFAS